MQNWVKPTKAVTVGELGETYKGSGSWNEVKPTKAMTVGTR